MPAKRTVPMRNPPSSRTDTISPGMPRHTRLALLLRDDEPAHADVRMDLEHEDPGRLEVVLAEVEGAFALDLEGAIVDRTERDFTLDGTCDAMELQLSRDSIPPAIAERFDGAHRASYDGEFQGLEPALDLVIVEPVAGPETVGVDLDPACDRRAVADPTIRDLGVEVSCEPGGLRADRVEARRRLHPDTRSLGHDAVSTHGRAAHIWRILRYRATSGSELTTTYATPRSSTVPNSFPIILLPPSVSWRRAPRSMLRCIPPRRASAPRGRPRRRPGARAR